MRCLTQRYLDSLAGSVPQEYHADLVTWFERKQDVYEGVGCIDRCSPNTGNDVTRLHAFLAGRAVGCYARYIGTILSWQVISAGYIRGDGLEIDSHVRSGDKARLDDLICHGCSSIDWDGKPQALRNGTASAVAHDQGIDPYYFPRQVDQGSTRVALVDRRVCLD